MMVNFSICVRRTPTQRTVFRFENVSSDLSVGELKKDILHKAGLDSQCQLELIYSCRSLQDETILNTVEGLEKGIKMIYASVASNPEARPPARKLNTVQQHELFLTFRTAVANPNFRYTLQNISKVETMQMLLATVPGLADDDIAFSMLQDWELLLHLADIKVLQVFAEKHPALIDAVSRILATESGAPIPDANQRRSSNNAGWLARSLGADMDEDMDEDNQQQPSTSQSRSPSAFSSITPAQLAAALNFAQNNIRQPVSQSPLQQPSLPEALRLQQQPPLQVPNPVPTNTSNNGLTPEMFTQALLQAMNQMEGGNPNRSVNSGPSSAPVRSEDARLREQFDRYLPQMRELGITDDSLSLRALQATNGDIEAALNLIYAGLVDD